MSWEHCSRVTHRELLLSFLSFSPAFYQSTLSPGEVNTGTSLLYYTSQTYFASLVAPGPQHGQGGVGSCGSWASCRGVQGAKEGGAGEAAREKPRAKLRPCVEELECPGPCQKLEKAPRRGGGRGGDPGTAGGRVGREARPLGGAVMLHLILRFPVGAGAGAILLGPGEPASGSRMILVGHTVIKPALGAQRALPPLV